VGPQHFSLVSVRLPLSLSLSLALSASAHGNARVIMLLRTVGSRGSLPARSEQIMQLWVLLSASSLSGSVLPFLQWLLQPKEKTESCREIEEDPDHIIKDGSERRTLLNSMERLLFGPRHSPNLSQLFPPPPPPPPTTTKISCKPGAVTAGSLQPVTGIKGVHKTQKQELPLRQADHLDGTLKCFLIAYS
jgi:hypothetical protein